MYLIIVITLLTLLNAFAYELIIPLQKFLKRPSPKEKSIQNEIINLRKELSKISMRNDYINYVKTERKIVSLENNLSSIQMDNKIRNLTIDYGLKYGIKFIFYLILLIVSIIYRKFPVIIFNNEQFNFTPLTSFMSFPCGIDGAISTPVWIFISSLTLRTIVTSIKQN